MKSYQEIINQESVFLNSFANREDVLYEFHGVYSFDSEWKKEAVLNICKDINILFASYGNDNYEGEAWVLFEKDGKLYEVHGSHCSCYGLEEQWEPEEVILQELEHRLLNGTFGEYDWAGNVFKDELCEFLGVKGENYNG